MTWYMQSTAARDTHWGTLTKMGGSVTAECGIVFWPRRARAQDAR
ncbi:MAG: hypothetical protein ACRDSZ_18935 [Pseudonocardiaceae bacterium]